MRILGKQLLTRFSKKHSDSARHLAVWQKVVAAADWKSSADVLSTYPTAKIIPSRRARFKIVGNKYRLIVEIDYLDKIVEVRFVGTHAEYDEVDASTI